MSRETPQVGEPADPYRRGEQAGFERGVQHARQEDRVAAFHAGVQAERARVRSFVDAAVEADEWEGPIGVQRWLRETDQWADESALD